MSEFSRMSRAELLQTLARHITVLERPHPLRVAIDGVDAAGKTTLADELVRPIEERGRPVIRASIDGFHRPRAERYHRGPDSPAGYYHDSFDYAAVRAVLLDPLGPGGSRRYRQALFDWRSDTALELAPETAPDDAILLFDGIFLQRPELAEVWDLRIFLQVDFEEVLRRAVLRDGAGPDAAAAIHERYHERYIPGQRLYLEAARPQERADILVDNNDPAQPRLILWRPPFR